MNISEGFIKRPIATSLLMAAIALFGLVAYRSLPVSDLPNVDFPTLLVAARLLPQGMPTPPTFTKVNPADQPILYLVITSTTVPPWTLDEYAETRIAQRISMVSGVAQVQVLGSQKFAVHAQLDPHSLAARQIGINEVETALRNWNVNTPTGSIIGPHKTYTLQ